MYICIAFVFLFDTSGKRKFTVYLWQNAHVREQDRRYRVVMLTMIFLTRYSDIVSDTSGSMYGIYIYILTFSLTFFVFLACALTFYLILSDIISGTVWDLFWLRFAAFVLTCCSALYLTSFLAVFLILHFFHAFILAFYLASFYFDIISSIYEILASLQAVILASGIYFDILFGILLAIHSDIVFGIRFGSVLVSLSG